jgi:hypothetical protein
MGATKDDERPEATVMLPGGGVPDEEEQGTMVLPGGGGPQESEATLMLPGGGGPQESEATMMLPEGLAQPRRSPPEPEAEGTLALTMVAPAPGGGTEVVRASSSSSGSSHGLAPGTQLASRGGPAAMPPAAGRRVGVEPVSSTGSGTWVIVLTVIAVIAGVTVGLLI